MRTTCIIVVNSSASVLHFRIPLIKYLQGQNVSILISASDTLHEKEILELGVRFSCFHYSNWSLSILSSLNYQHYLENLFKENNPGFILSFQAKSNVFSGLAKREAQIQAPLLPMVEGLGDPFIRNSIKWRLIRFLECILYKKALQSSSFVFFLNKEDLEVFTRKKILPVSKTVLTGGIGIDPKSFPFFPLPEKKLVLYCGRLLKTKGVLDFCKAAQRVKRNDNSISFAIVGPEGDVKQKTLAPYIKKGIISYTQETNEIVSFYQKCTCLVLPSSREGFPVSVMEAMSCGRPVIAYKVPGCKEAIQDNVTGFLVKPHDIAALAEEIQKLINDPEKLNQMSLNSRRIAEKEFIFSQSQKEYTKIIQKLLTQEKRS